MNILIIGGTRFLGRHLTEALIRGNQEVTLLNRGNFKNKVPFYEDVEWLICDRHDEEKFTNLLADREFDVVIDTCGYTLEEVEMTVKILRGKIGKYIFTSTIDVAKIRDEDDRQILPIKNRRLFPIITQSPYAYNKSVIEEFLVEQFDKSGFPFICLRPCEINGPGEVREWYYIDRLKHGRQKILIPGFGDNLVQPGYIDDIIQGFLLAIVKENAIGECYNITGDDIISLNDYIKVIAETMGEKVRIVNMPYQTFYDLVNTRYSFPFCNKHSFVVDISKIKTELGYQPEVSIKDGIRKSLVGWTEEYTKYTTPYNPTGEFEFISYDLEDLLITVWEKVMEESTERIRVELLQKGMLI
ncbi:NAD-dependent epimerase/dehydratase family protein [candidate division KSB1 bacterium]|nr:NAD-dependent epimerase/dehydratase family protein [candidate division KSB1 bacterium]